MPDDITTPAAAEAPAAVAEQDIDQEMEAGFADLDGDETAQDGNAAEDAATGEKGDAQADGKDKAPAPAPAAAAADGTDAEPDPVAALLAEAEAREKATPAAAAAPGTAGQPPAQPGRQGASAEAPRATKEEVKEYLDFFSDTIPDEKFIIGDKELDFKALEEDMPGISDALRLSGGRAAVKYVGHLAERGEIITGHVMKQFVDQVVNPMRAELEDLRFWLDVAKQDPEALTLAQSAEMDAWIKTQPEPVQRMAKNLRTPKDVVAFVNGLRKSKAKAKTADHDAKARKDIERQRALHGHSASPGRRPATADAIGAASEEEEGFASA
ncbi:MAG: hypothetical protein M0R22_11690 [Dehalococcoidia bacterium]|jgi:hypothetical protein|nr:hypothetical protein [Dehalococcoidia bacterium]